MAPDFRQICGKVLAVVCENRDLDTLLGQVTELLVSIEGVDRVIISLSEPDSRVFVVRGAAGKPGVAAMLPVAGDKFSFKDEIVMELFSRKLSCVNLSAQGEKNEVITEIAIPLSGGASLLGVFVIGSKTADKFSQEDCELFADLGRIISLAVENRIVLSRECSLEPLDPLTGLYSSRYFEAKVSEEIKRVDRYGGVFSILIAGIDNLAELAGREGNFGRAQVLKDAASLFVQELREVDIAARYSESEFAAVLPQASEEECLQVANRLIAKLKESELNSGKSSGRTTFSVGLATYLDDSPFSSGLLEAADIALCSARAKGGDRAMTYREASAQPGDKAGEK